MSFVVPVLVSAGNCPLSLGATLVDPYRNPRHPHTGVATAVHHRHLC
jgi:hypothetical protein